MTRMERDPLGLSFRTARPAIAARLAWFWVRAHVAHQGPPGARRLGLADLKRIAGPWYHDFTSVGLPTVQRSMRHVLNQRDKDAVLGPLIASAVADASSAHDGPRGLELFSADGYYAQRALKAGAAHMDCIDFNAHELANGAAAARALGTAERIAFNNGDVHSFEGVYDFAISAGGFYHIDDPVRLLKVLADHVEGPLVIQTAYSIARDDASYFEAPAPGWDWGCRFSEMWFRDAVERTGWNIDTWHVGELSANVRPEDRGSIYALCRPA